MNYVKEERETMKKIIVMVLTVLTVIGTGLTSLAATDSAQGNLPTTGSAGAVFRAGGNTAQNGSKGRVFRPTDKTESANTSSNGNVYRPGGNSGYIGPSGSGKVYRPGGATDGSYAKNKNRTEAEQGMVWIPKTGTKYHRIKECSNMINPSQISKEEAVKRGYTPCNDCYN